MIETKMNEGTIKGREEEMKREKGMGGEEKGEGNRRRGVWRGGARGEFKYLGE